MSYATYFESFDVKELLKQFPLDQAFTDKFKAISREQLRAEQAMQTLSYEELTEMVASADYNYFYY